MNRTESMHFTSDANRRAPVPRAAGRTAHLALPLALIIVLFQGCGTAPQTGSAAATATAPQRAPNTAITPQLQAELDAAMALVKAEQYEPAAEAFKKLQPEAQGQMQTQEQAPLQAEDDKAAKDVPGAPAPAAPKPRPESSKKGARK
jgi:hypothetical protein